MTARPGFALRALAVPIAFAFAFPTLALAQGGRSPRTAEAPVAIKVDAQPIASFDARDPSRRQFGMLEFRGGLALTSSYKEFGGISSLRVFADGARFLAVTDRGRWLRGRIVYDGARPTGIADAEMAPILGPDGKPYPARRWYDSEAVAIADGAVYVSFERVNRIAKFNYGKDGLLARGQEVRVPEAVRKLPHNKGIEGLVVVPKDKPNAGALIGFSERGLDKSGDPRGFVIGGPKPGAFAVKRADDMDVTDAALLPPGDVLILERHFSWLSGVKIRIRRLALSAIRAGATLDGPTIFAADSGHQIDNMEGLGVHRSSAGETVLTLVSDDNFSMLQRTLLLQFTLVAP